MIKINKLNNKVTINFLVTKYNLAYTENDDFMAALNNEDVLEFISYTTTDDRIIINYISNISDDFALSLGILKTILFVADVNTVEYVILPLNYERFAKSLRFENKETHYSLKLSEYSSKC